MRRIVMVGAAVAALMLVTAGPARAHGDDRVASRTMSIEPGGSVTFAAELHYHRITGRVHASGPVSLVLTRDDGGAVLFEREAADAHAFNELVACCIGVTWTAATFTVANPGDEAVEATARVRLVHDDLAVSVYGAEGGVGASVVVLGGVWALVLRRAYRRRGDVPLSHGVTILAATVGAVALVSAFGAVRFGGQPAPAFVAGAGAVPVLPANPIASSATLLTMAAMAAWAWAGARWIRSQDRGTGWGLVGACLLAVVVATAVLVGTTYGAIALPIASAVAAGAPLAVAGTIVARSR